MVEISSLKQFTRSSFPKYFHKKRPACLEARDWLYEAGKLKATPEGLRAYHKSLAFANESDPEKGSDLYQEMCRGWFIGTREGKKGLLKDVEHGVLGSSDALRGFGEDRAEMLLHAGL